MHFLLCHFLSHGEKQTRGLAKILEAFVLIRREWLWQTLVLVSGSDTGCVMRTLEFGSWRHELSYVCTQHSANVP